MKNKIKNDEIFENIDRLQLSLKFIEKRYEKFYYLLDAIPQEKLNQIFMRNLYYFSIVIEKIKYNFKQITIIKKLVHSKKTKKKLKIKLKELAKKKSIVSIILLEHLVNMMKKYNIDSFDFEVQSMIDNDEKEAIDRAPEKYKEDIKEEFKSIDMDYVLNTDDKVVEPFWKAIVKGIKKVLNKIKKGLMKAVNFIKNLINKIVGIFKSIFNAMMKIFKMLAQIVLFIVTTLVKVIKLFFDLLMMLFNLITKTIPRMIAKVFSFVKLLWLKAKYTGITAIFMYFGLNLLIQKYWELLLGDLGDAVPSEFTEYPALLLSTHFFWTQTRTIRNIQFKILDTTMKFSDTYLKLFFVPVIGVSPNDRFFRYRGRNIGTKINLFFAMIVNNIGKVIMRGLMFVIAFKVIMKVGSQHFIKIFPSLREFILFPIILVRAIVMFLYNFTTKQILGHEEE